MKISSTAIDLLHGVGITDTVKLIGAFSQLILADAPKVVIKNAADNAWNEDSRPHFAFHAFGPTCLVEKMELREIHCEDVTGSMRLRIQ
jgi:hypothetical protein